VRAKINNIPENRKLIGSKWVFKLSSSSKTMVKKNIFMLSEEFDLQEFMIMLGFVSIRQKWDSYFVHLHGCCIND
jgi:hypothetical protein